MFAYSMAEQSDMKPLEPLHTEELYALTEKNRPFLESWFAWIEHVRTPYDTRVYIDEMARRRKLGEGYGFGLFHAGRLCGVAELTGIASPDRSCRLGFWLCEADQGKGRMTQACGALTDYAIDTCGLNRVEIRVSAENARARAVPERLGYTMEGVARQAKLRNGRFVDMAVYSMLAEEWSEMDRMSRNVGY